MPLNNAHRPDDITVNVDKGSVHYTIQRSYDCASHEQSYEQTRPYAYESGGGGGVGLGAASP